MKWRMTIVALAATLGLGVVADGCATAGPNISRVQTNLVDKSIFQGEWWYATTIIDVQGDEAEVLGATGFAPFSGDMTSVDLGVDGGQSLQMARIKWVIDEHYLYAYRAYELIAGGNDDGRSPSFRGQPLAAFPITDHVDVRRDYNAGTGEVTNVTVENTADRQWYERQFMRVDWANNAVAPFYTDDLQLAQLFHLLQPEPVGFHIDDHTHGGEFPSSYWPQFVRVSEDPTYRNAHEWTTADGDPVHYMSFVNQQVWSPGPNCFYYGSMCSSAAVTTRNSFLRVPPQHNYASATETHSEFDRFGLFRSYQPTYVRGGQPLDSLHSHCSADSDCVGGSPGSCDMTHHWCVGGLTSDYGETDFLTFYRPRHNFFSNGLTDIACTGDWQCSNVFGDGAAGAPANGYCDRAARRCARPTADRTVQHVAYTLSPHFPQYLVRSAFNVVGDWNEAFMRGWRSARGQAVPEPADLSVMPQSDNPTLYCWRSADGHGSPEVRADGTCPYKYNPFQDPATVTLAARHDGTTPMPYDCWITRADGAATTDVAHPHAFDDYPTTGLDSVYGYKFTGTECMFVLENNPCDTDNTKACRELGDIRYQFYNYVSNGFVQFGGVSIPLMDPTNGELITSNANLAAESIESVGTTASHYFPVLRGEVSEESWFGASELRGYFARAGHTELPPALAASGTDGYSVSNPTRPAMPADVHALVASAVERVAPRVEGLHGRDGRALLMVDRMRNLQGTSQESQILGGLGRDLVENRGMTSMLPASLAGASNDQLAADPDVRAQISPFGDGLVGSFASEAARDRALSMRNFDPAFNPDGPLYNSRYWQYWADQFSAPALGIAGPAPASLGDRNTEAAIRMRQLYNKMVMWHEFGHSVGLRHNFAGTFDRDNYAEGYCDIATAHPLPDYAQYDNPTHGGDGDGNINGRELDHWLTDLRTTRNDRAHLGAGNVMANSIMDYHGDLSDTSGLGHYDIGTTMWNYFDQVEVWNGNPRLTSTMTSLSGLACAPTRERVIVQYYRGGESCSTSTDCPFSDTHFTSASAAQPVFQRCLQNPRFSPVPTPCGGTDRNCVCSTFDTDMQDYVATAPASPTKKFPVKYLFCTDDRVNDISWCSRFDAGESFQEAVDHWRRVFEENYPGTTYFRHYRGGLGGRGGARGGGSVGSIVDAVKIFQHFLFRYFYEPGFRSQNGPLGIDDQYLASIDVMNWLVELASLPDVGSYKFTADDEGGIYSQLGEDPAMTGADFSLLTGAGYHMWSAYESGQNGFFRRARAGVFYDKYIALLAIALRDWGLSYQLDERYYIDFYDFFALEVGELFGGYIQDDPHVFAPRVTLDATGPTVHPINIWRGNNNCGVSGNEPCRGPLLNVYADLGHPVANTSTELLRDWAAILSLAQFPAFFDTTFEEYLSIYKLGNGDGHTIPTQHADGSPTCTYGNGSCPAMATDPALPAVLTQCDTDTDCDPPVDRARGLSSQYVCDPSVHVPAAPTHGACVVPDSIQYTSDHFHETFVAVTIRPNIQYSLREEQLGFNLLRGILSTQTRVAALEAVCPGAGCTVAQMDELNAKRSKLVSDDSFLEYLIDLQRRYGVASYL